MSTLTVRDVLTRNPAAGVWLFVDPDDARWVAVLEGVGDPENPVIRTEGNAVDALLCLLCAPAPVTAEQVGS